MGHADETTDVYHNLTESNENKGGNQKWTLYLILCCLTACSASFQFGYNIGSTNLPTELIKEFISRTYHPNFYVQREIFLNKSRVVESHSKALAQVKMGLEAGNDTSKAQAETKLKEMNANIQENFGLDFEEFLNQSQLNISEAKLKIDAGELKINNFNKLMWTVTNCLFVVGGMFGAFVSKYVAEYFGRKKGIIFHYIFTIIGAILVIIAPYINSPVCVIISRFLFGVQGGMSCGLIPTYLAEISPSALRGATGVIHQLCLTIGICTAQTLGFRQLLGTKDLWHFLLGVPIIPAVFGGIFLLIFFPESPRALLINNRDEDAAKKALHRLRNTTNISGEIDQMNQEARESKTNESISLKELFTSADLRWPLVTGLILQLTQQLCGINAIFFYSNGIFKESGIEESQIQYAIFLTGVINVIITVICVPLIDRLGRKPLLVVPMAVIVLDFIVLTVFLNFKAQYPVLSYASIACIILFIICFAIGLGPIPFLYVAECFRQDARSAALAVCMFTNWVANLLLTLTFPYLAEILSTYVFLVFTVIVAVALVVIIKKVPETKGRSVEEIMASFHGKRPNYDESTGRLMSNTKV